MTESLIESVLVEDRTFQPPANAGAYASSMQDWQALSQRFEQDYEGEWAKQARQNLQWKKPFTKVLNQDNPPFYRWFEDGELNLSENCLDRHIAQGRGAQTAIIWEGEDGTVRRISYDALLKQVSLAANAMLSLGVTLGDRVVIYMPMIPEAAIAMLACTRIGATHSVVFAGFSAASLHDRIEDAGAKLVITADGGQRRGAIHELKPVVDQALQDGCESIEHVLVVGHCRPDEAVEENNGRDLDWHQLLAKQSDQCPAVAVSSEHPLFILYTSGSTGKPKGIVHSTAGYLLWAHLTMRYSFDFRPDHDVFWCTADIGWITGHTYSIYGPLCQGGTTLMYEGVPTWPDPGRFWKVCAKHQVTIFYTAPTAIRALIKAGDQWPKQHDLSSLRVLGTVGEPINPEAWMWYYRTIGGERCPIVDTWWQTETGGHMIAAMPFAVPAKPGSASLPLPGVFAEVVTKSGETVTEGGGLLVLTRPWPSMLRGIWGDDQRYIDTYWNEFDGRFYFAGDGARKDDDGFYWILGRVDDVLNVSGHRLGTMEIESALVSHSSVAEAAVVGCPHDVKGESIFAFVVLKKGEAGAELQATLRQHVANEIGPIAKPDDIRFAENLPKTRSGKIMRRLLREIAAGREITQDISTLEDPSVIKRLSAGD